MSADQFLQSLSYLLPRGFAWPRDPGSTLMRVVRPLAQELDDLHQFTHGTVMRWQPATTTRLDEWEAATGLPDPCFANDDDTRRQMLLMRLRGAQLPFADSSPAAPAVIEAICASVGYAATLAYNTPLRCGHRIGRRMGRLDGELYVTVVLPSGRLRVGTGRVGARLIFGTKTGSDLACLLGRVIPARFRINLILI